MAKTKHNNFLDTIDEVFSAAKNNGTMHLYSEDAVFTGRTIRIENKDMYHFGTTSYLGMEQDERLKDAAIEAIKRFGTQFPISKSYISHGLVAELEDLLKQMFGIPVIVAKNSTLAHIAVIPSTIRDEDAVILDHQVHYSVQSACQLLKPRRVPVDMIRHSNMEMLEDRIRSYGTKYDKIYYMADGVYSMYGDFAPLKELTYLLDKYPAFHLYVDDVHGMSWAGKHGTGYVKSVLPDLHPKMILISTLSKTFGASGSTIVIPDQELYRKVKTFGGPLTFSAQLEPSAVAAAIASAKIHLTDEIYEIQNELRARVDYCSELFQKTEIPLVEENICPLFYVAAGLPTTGYNLINRLKNEGFYINLGIFPGVPIKNTGLRVTISRRNHFEDIKKMVEAIAYHYPKALEEEGQTVERVKKAFKMPVTVESHLYGAAQSSETMIEHFTTITDIKRKEWDLYMGGKGIFDYDGLQDLEKAFSKNEKPEDNWNFHYIVIRDKSFKPVLLTFFTCTLWKDDMLSPYHVSVKVESKRKDDPYYLTSRMLCMGSMATEGDQLFIDRENPVWEKAIIHMLNYISSIQEKEQATGIILRDFHAEDEAIKNILLNQGYFTVTMPETCIIQDIDFRDEEEYLEKLSTRSRKHVKKDVIKNLQFLNVEYKDRLSDRELQLFYSMYQTVANRNFDLNYFQYPYKFVETINNSPNWEFTVISLKEKTDQPLSISVTYKNVEENVTGVILGMDYNYLTDVNIYKQILYHTIVRAKKLGHKKVYLGFSATIEKRKFGATIIPKVAYMQTKDNYKIELLENLHAVGEE